MQANFRETNPVPVKTAMVLLGFCQEQLRAPLGPPTDETREALRKALDDARLSGDER
jgi:dihydrodipicolinate synthase/N-acetylneuraminate lyase